VSTAVERFDESARRRVGAHGRTIVREHEVLRHPVYTRVIHWSVAIFFLLSLLSGLAIYTPWLYHALTPLFGGGAMTRFLHPWFGIGFEATFVLLFLNWLQPMTWTADDRRWMKRLKSYVTNAEDREPDYVDFFNAGQKLYFWILVASAVVFLVSGIPMWFPRTFGRITVDIGSILHDLAALVMLGAFVVHVYEGTAAQPGTFRAMTRGAVERRWAWTHHPAWYRRVAGRVPPADRDRAPAPRPTDQGPR
jgi:formate dehydrogenase subunit gamma